MDSLMEKVQSNSNGYTYNGDWKLGKKSGIAVIKYDGGGMYEGEVINGVRQGSGKLTLLDGSVLEGFFNDGTISEGINIIF